MAGMILWGYLWWLAWIRSQSLSLPNWLSTFDALRMEGRFVRVWHFAACLRRDASGDATLSLSMVEAVGIVGPIRQQRFGSQDHQVRSFVVAHLPFAEQHYQRAAHAVTDREEL
jgi:hypothetical protein